MNTEQFKGQWLQLKGELKRRWGQFTDDDLLQIDGNYDKFVGRVQARYGDQKQDILTWLDEWSPQSKPSPRAGQRC